MSTEETRRSRYEDQFLPQMEKMPDGNAACVGKHELFQRLIEGRGGNVARKEASQVCNKCVLRDRCPARVVYAGGRIKKKAPSYEAR